MSIFGDIKDTLFGSTDDSAQKAQVQANARAQDFIEQVSGQARGDALTLQPYSDHALQAGAQGSADMLGGALRQQLQTYGDGNYAAQQQLLAGMPQYQNAILGLPVDNSALQPVRLDTSSGMDFMFNPTLPSMGNPDSYTDLLGGNITSSNKDLSEFVKPGMTNSQLVAKAHSDGMISDKDYKLFQQNFADSGTGSGQYWASTGNAGELINSLNSQGEIDPKWRSTLENFFNLMYPSG